MIMVYALKETIQSGSRTFPVYVGLMPAATVAEVTDVPRFHDSTKNSDIARNVSSKPVKEWQRPEIGEKVAAIRMLYDNTGKFMPNPVLLGENVSAAHPPLAKPFVAAGNSTPVWEITIDNSPGQLEKPLWILDGQHRIAGLAASAQSANPIPVVFLLNQGSTYYQPDTLAEIFAEVTTAATPLGPLHKEWLSFAFDLNEYAVAQAEGSHQRRSMQTIIELCQAPSFSGAPNPYFDRIRFNDHASPVKPPPGGHAYDCKELKAIVYNAYYNAQKHVAELPPLELAREMSAARRALESVTATTSTAKSVFFGDDNHHQKIMEDAYWHGVLTYLSYHPCPASWADVLRTLKFDQTSWDFSWKKSLHGRDQSRSRNLALKVMGDAFRAGALSEGANTIADFLRGNGASFQVEAYRRRPSGSLDKGSLKTLPLKKGDTLSFPIEDRVCVRIPKRFTSNIQEIEVTDKRAPPGTLVRYGDILGNQGLQLDLAKHKNPLELLITLHHYGGVSSTADIDIVWGP